MKPSISPPSERYLRIVGRFDRLIVALVLLLAFLLGAFPARNSDVWMHLAAGGSWAILQPGVDPFNFTTSDIYWANHAWLYDGGLYLVTLLGGPEGFGGMLAVFLKACAVVGLAWLMMRIRRPSQGPWAPAAVATLALVTLSPGLEFRPMLASLLLLAGTLLVLTREGKPPADPGLRGWALLASRSPRRLWVLPFLFALWVNLDGWFWLGPFTVALFLFGAVLQERWQPIHSRAEAAPADEKRTLWRVLAVGLAACLLNPHHVRAFVWPAELRTDRFAALQGDPNFATYFTGPFGGGYFTLHTGMSVAGLVYYFLLAVTVSSFVLNWGGWRWWRLVVVVPFALLGVACMRLIPFFAVVAGPIITLNIQDFIEQDMSKRMEQDPRWRRTAVAGRGITVQTLLVFLVLGWAGWLHAPQAQRRFGLGIVAEPSLHAASLELRDRSIERVVNLHPALADYIAWYAPGTRSYFDSRLNLMGESLPGYVRMRSGAFATGWYGAQQRWAVRDLALYGATAEHTGDMFSRLVQEPDWTLVWFDGRASWFRHGDPSGPSFDPAPLAFGPHSSQAPPRGPARLPRLNYLEHFVFGGPARPLDTDLADALIRYYSAAAHGLRGHRLRQAAELVGSGLQIPELAARLALQPDLASPPERGPPAAPLLAIRAARRAQVENPDDLFPSLFLTEAYSMLWRVQENYWAGIGGLPETSPSQLLSMLRARKGTLRLSPWVSRTLDPRQLLRQAQVVAALRHQLLIDPDSDYAHRSLYELFWRMGYYDVALEHLRAEVAILERKLAPRDLEALREGQKRDQPMHASAFANAYAADNLHKREQLLTRTESDVDLVRRAYEQSRSPELGAFQPFGLVNTAMLKTREGQGSLQPAEVELYLYLLLTTGRLDELQDALIKNPSLPILIGPRFDWYAAMLAAVRGNYQEADRRFAKAQQALPALAPPLGALLQCLTADQMMTPLLGRVTLRPILLDWGTRQAATMLLYLQEAAELSFLRGLLALEQGDTQAARQHFEVSLAAGIPDATFAPVARRYLDLLSKNQGAGAKH